MDATTEVAEFFGDELLDALTQGRECIIPTGDRHVLHEWPQDVPAASKTEKTRGGSRILDTAIFRGKDPAHETVDYEPARIRGDREPLGGRYLGLRIATVWASPFLKNAMRHCTKPRDDIAGEDTGRGIVGLAQDVDKRFPWSPYELLRRCAQP
jgi:hypothetical protein